MEEKQKTNTFEDMANTLGIPEEDVSPHKPDERVAEEEVLGLDIFSQGSWISSPEVGEFIEFTVDKIVKNPVVSGTNKTTGEKFDIGVTKKNGETIRYDIVTSENERFTLNSWALFYLFIGKDSAFAAEAQKRKSMSGIKVKLTRNYDGSVPNKKVSDVMKLYDLETKEAAIAYQKEVAKALKEGRLFTLEILE